MSQDVSPEASAQFTGTLDMKTNLVKFKVTFQNIIPAIAHVHRGIFPDPGVVDATFGVRNNILNDRFTVTEEDAQMLAHGGLGLYMDLHLSAEGGPQMGGQIVRQ